MRFARAALACALAAAIAPAACGGDGDPPRATGAGGGGGDAPGGTTSGPTSVTSNGAGGELPEVFTVTGVVKDGEAPLEGAIVMQGGGAPDFVTGPDGVFSIEMTRQIPGTPTLVAAKVGYRTRGVELVALPGGPITLTLLAAAPPDNTAYDFGDPGTGDPAHDTSTAYCGHCHSTLTAQFQTSGHARAARDPLVQDLYAGTAEGLGTAAACAEAGGIWRAGSEPGTAGGVVSKCYVGAGVLPDLNPGCGGPGQLACDDPARPAASRPTAFGGCADCHAPGIDGPAGGRDLLEATGLAFEYGVHCDVCHKARDVDLGLPPGAAGALVLQRPMESSSDLPGGKPVPVMFGPYPDVPNEFMGGSYQPRFTRSEFCGACHEQKQAALVPGAALDPARWPEGLPTHATFSEWSEGAWNTPGTQCQFCHMPEVEGLESTVDVTDATNAGITFGFLRPAGSIRGHVFRGPLAGSPRLIDGAVSLGLGAAAQGGELAVTVQLHNQACGHAIPTGEPMRSLVLVVRAACEGAALAPSSGMTVNDAGGALAEGRVGEEATLGGAALSWAAGAARAKPGDVVRVVRPTGIFDDYTGIGLFADPALSAADKGMPILAPVGEAEVVAASGGEITLAAAIAAEDGDVVLLGEALAWPPVDGQPSAALAGASGYTFAKVLVDPLGRRGVPHHRAVDIASDNRIPPQGDAFTSHGFTLPPGCPSATVTAVLLYRPVPVALARERGAEARDHIVATSSQNVALN